MADQYTLNFVNKSSNDWVFCCYQQDPKIGPKDVRSLAWFTKAVAAGSKTKFQWTIDYSFVWSEMGELVPGVIFDATQVMDASTQVDNAITLTRLPNTAFKFVNQTTDPGFTGSLVVNQDKNIPLKTAAVGIGMSGVGTFAVPAQPNIQVSFSPHPTYWVTFGDYITGQVLDIQQVTGKAQVPYATNVFSMWAILSEDNNWTIQSTASVNSHLLAMREQSDSATFMMALHDLGID
jgi:hypothetical protein